MGLQIFGTRKCRITRKAERFFKERDVSYQFVDLAEKGISPGELRAVASALGPQALLDSESARYRERGLAHMVIDPVEAGVEDPLLLKTPIVRDGKKACVGDDPESWKGFLP